MDIGERMPEMITGVKLWQKYPYTESGLVDGASVSTWLDSSGNGNNATQTGTARPVFKQNVTANKPGVRFRSASQQFFNIPAISSAGAYTCFTVMLTSQGKVATAMGNVGGPAIILQNTDARMYTTDRAGYGHTPSPQGVSHVITATADGAGAISMWQDGTALSVTLAPNAYPAIDYTYLGLTGTSYPDCDWCEIIYYNRVLNSTERASVEKYLGTKYSLPVAGGTAADPSTISGLKGWWKADTLGGAGTPFDPSTMAGMKLWLKADSLALANDAGVANWPDSSGNNNHALQATPANQPIFKTVGMLNGKPAVYFDGTARWLTLTTPIPAVSAPWMVIAVVYNAGQIYPIGPNPAVFNGTAFRFNASVGICVQIGSSRWQSGGGRDFSQWHVYTGASTPAAWQDDVSVALTEVVSQANPCDFGTIGSDVNATQWGSGLLAEELVFDHILTATDRQNVNAYLRNKYGIAAAP